MRRDGRVTLIVALLLTASACSSSSSGEAAGDEASAAEAEAAAEAGSTVTTGTTPSADRDATDQAAIEIESDAGGTTTITVASPDLEVTLPDEEPETASFDVIEVGDGPAVGAGDLIFAAWEMVAFGTGDVVESTADDFGAPVLIEIGAGFVPAALDEALDGQTVGTRLEVQFPVGMEDLPDYLDAEQAYVLAVQIVELAPPPLPQTTTTTTTTTTESATPDGYVPASGPLLASPPVGSALPDRNSSDVVRVGDGAELAEGDTVQIDYVVVSWSTGDVVFATEDEFGGPQTIVLGDRTVPRILESAIFRQPVGSRVQVIYAPDLPDLPEGLSTDDAFVVAVDIVSVG